MIKYVDVKIGRFVAKLSSLKDLYILCLPLVSYKLLNDKFRDVFFHLQHLLIMNHGPLVSGLVDVILNDGDDTVHQNDSKNGSPAFKQRVDKFPSFVYSSDSSS